MEYQATTTLAAGNSHTYSFEFSNGTGTWRLPLNDVPFTGPIVAPFELSGVGVSSPGTGNGIAQLGQPLTVSVTYRSPTGNPPTTASVLIDGQSHPMVLCRGLAHDRHTATGTRPRRLAKGDHYLQFEFSDGTGLEDFQENAFSVTPITLRDSAVSPTSGSTSTEFTFSTVYYGQACAYRGGRRAGRQGTPAQLPVRQLRHRGYLRDDTKAGGRQAQRSPFTPAMVPARGATRSRRAFIPG